MQQTIDPNELQKTLGKLALEQQELKRKQAEREMRERADKILEFQATILGAAFDKAMAYANLIILGGYATYFALWSQVRGHLTPFIELWSALCMLISALTFVLFEVYKMVYTGRTLNKQRDILMDESIKDNPDEILNRFTQYQRVAQSQSVVFGKVWLWNVGVAVIFGLVAASLLLYGLVRGLIVSYFE